MLKGLTIKFLVLIFLFGMTTSSVSALEVSAFKPEDDGEATITFCKTLQIKNVSLNKNSVIQTVIFEKDDGEFENIAVLNKDFANHIISCFEGICDMRTKCKTSLYSLMSARKVQDKDLVVAKVSFDRDISAVFLISSYHKENKVIYRIKTPQDLKFLNKKYKKNFRNWLIKEIKYLL
ncbi:MAG: hypothetical protein J5594_00365 [Elusimicrobiaceae bacterium]|nr:hypothetical protein [Elusimicrobiaceae bacterium]